MGGINVKYLTTFELKWMYLPNSTKAKKAKSLDTIMKNLRTYGTRPGENPDDDGGELNCWDDIDDPEIEQQQQQEQREVVTQDTAVKSDIPNVIKLKPLDSPNNDKKPVTENINGNNGTKAEKEKTANKKTTKKGINAVSTDQTQTLASLR